MHLQLWLALTEMNQFNGGLRVAPGAHRVASEHRYVGHHVEMDTPDHTVAVDAAPGDVIIFSSYLPHSTAPNSTGVDRLAYVAEFLPVSEPDFSVAPPHFVVATGGTPDPHFTDLTPGWSS
jgi:ectoine hydroxylase-related dioxygenase (phytanoyl-CoA dioxygenase family)